ncbi:MAG: DUF4011 domain-containing protein [SAR86 cluster bacterium]|nr:DUF4011 domain-containing protein [SAR86 cluster bacterium]
MDIKKQLLTYSEKLLALTTRNKLIHSSFSSRELGFRFIDELPQKLAEKISLSKRGMTFDPLPPLDSEPPEEQKPDFKRKIDKLKITDETYLEDLKKIDEQDIENPDEISEREEDALRALKDRLREDLGLPKRVSGTGESDLRRHAQNHNINPDYNLPEDTEENRKKRQYNDDKIQTLILPDILNARLRKLKQRYKTNLEETGQNTLYLCFGFLQWIQDRGVSGKKKRLAPLLMMQVQFNLDKKNNFNIKAVDEFDILENNTLKHYLNEEFDIRLPKPPKITVKNGKNESEVLDIEAYLKKVKTLVSKKGWDVLRRSSVGIFHTQELTMHEDLKSIAENPNELLATLLSGKTVSGSDEIYDVDDKEHRKLIPALIDAADSSQHSAIIDMLNGKSFVLRGPPGTGKSQTICNMIAAGIYSGKKVLFVADKEAALEVVRTRLKAAGLDDYVLKLYSAKASKQTLWGSVRERLNSPTTRINSESLNTKIKELTKVRDELNEYKDFIGSEFGKTNKTVHDLLWEQEILINKYPIGALESLSFPTCDKITNDQQNKFIESFNSLESFHKEVFKNVSYFEHPWISAKASPKTTIERDKFNNSIKAWSENLQIMLQGHQDLIKTGLPADNFNLNDLSEYLNICKNHLPDNFQNESGLEEPFLIDLIGKEPEELQQGLELVDTLEDFLSKEEKAKESELEKEAVQSVYTSLDSLDLIEADYDGSLEGLLKEKQAQANKNIHFLEPIISFLQDLNVESINLSSLTVLEKFTFLNSYSRSSDRMLLNRAQGRFKEEEFKKKIKLIWKGVSEADNLRESVQLNYLVSSSELRKCALILKTSSIFSIFNEDYRKSNKIFKRISDLNLSKPEKVKIFESAASYKEFEEAFKQDEILATVFETTNLYDVKATDAELLHKSLEKISEFKFAEKESPIFQKFNESPNQFIEQFSSLSVDESLISELSNFDIDAEADLKESFDLIKLRSKEIGSSLDQATSLNMSGFLFNEIINLYKLLTEITELDKKINSLLGSTNYLEFSKRESLEDNLEELKTRIHLLKDIEIERRQKFLEIKDNLIPSFSLLETFYNNLDDSIKDLNKVFDIVKADPFEDLKHEQISIEHLNEFLDKHNTCGSINEFFDLRKEEDDLQKGPIADFYNNFLKQEGSTKDLSSKFQSWLVQKQYEKLNKEKSNVVLLNKYIGKKLNSNVTSLKKLDEEIQLLIRKQISINARKMDTSAPRGRGGRSSERTEQELLEYGSSLKTFPKGSVRNHLSRSASALSCNLPCWMVTPPNISTFIPLKQEFDLLIIDEASQMSPPRALPALARAKQCVIVGDENQLPPTSFFARQEDEDDPVIDVQESILDLAKTIWNKPRMLKWHYRSKHQDLIKFQNNFIYDNSLIIPPSTIETGDSHFGVHSHFLPNAIYRQGGTNEDEAKKIIELIINHSENYPDKSLGVAVMNVKQRSLIDQDLNLVYQNNNKVRNFLDEWVNKDEGLNKFFIKNLENVQGDERDVIIVGTNFGKLKEGAPVLQRFFPINQAGGERRLNVITTRARESLHLVTSLTSMDIKTKAKGTTFLSEYISFAKTKELPLGSSTDAEPDSPFEEWAIAEIEMMGFIAVPQVGVQGFKIDIGVKHPDLDGFILAVECDGATYHSSKAARDRDLLRQNLLENFGWKFHRIWSTDWIWDREGTTKKLETALTRAYDAKKTKVV